MVVEVDGHAGFCWGVVRAVGIAERTMEANGELFSLGDIIHNPEEIKRLEAKGLRTITHADLKNLGGKHVLVRAHGEPPGTFELARQYNITIVDATCPVVSKVQERIRKFYDAGYQIAIFGKAEHAEVVGLLGQTKGDAIVVKSVEEIDKIDLRRKTVLFSQTTMDKGGFHLLKEELQRRVKELVVASMEETAEEHFRAKDTICGQVFGRDRKLRIFAREHDVVVFVAGRKSSNGKVLFEMCREENSRTHFVERGEEVDPLWFAGAARVGVTGATSTPQWLMEEVRKSIEVLSEAPRGTAAAG